MAPGDNLSTYDTPYCVNKRCNDTPAFIFLFIENLDYRTRARGDWAKVRDAACTSKPSG